MRVCYHQYMKQINCNHCQDTEWIVHSDKVYEGKYPDEEPCECRLEKYKKQKESELKILFDVE